MKVVAIDNSEIDGSGPASSGALESPVAIVLSPWLPTPHLPYAGSFVVDFVDYAGTIYPRGLTTIHIDDTFRSNRRFVDLVAARGLAARAVQQAGASAGVSSIHIPLPVRQGSGWRDRVEAARVVGKGLARLPERLSQLGRGTLPAHIHAHVGGVTGSAVLPWLGDHDLFVYEHASFLFDLLGSDAKVKSRYREVFQHARRITSVNPTMTRRLSEEFPEAASRMSTHPNALDFGRFVFKQRVAPLTNWLYVGNLKADKGLVRLLEAFNDVASIWPDVELTIVGAGPDQALVEEMSTGNRVRLIPPVPPSQMPAVLSGADLLVHLSRGETFGMTALEAVASGVPVLVTSTDGSEYTLRPIIETAGTIVPQSSDRATIVESYRELREMPGRLDLLAAREDLRSRFSFEAAADRLGGLVAGASGPIGQR